MPTPPTPLLGDPRLPRRFWNRIRVDPDTGCWVWKGKPGPDGYPSRTSTPKGRKLPYRWSYEELIGPIPAETLNHKCLNTMCCFPVPTHAGDPMSRADNARDAKYRVTHCPQGHPYDFENTFINKKGARNCRQCMRAATKRWQQDNPEKNKALYTRSNALKAARRVAAKAAAPPPPPKPPRVECIRGHEWNETNIGCTPNGSYYCRVCLRERARARRAGPTDDPQETVIISR